MRYLFVSVVLIILAGCKSETSPTGLSNDRVKQIEQSDTYKPWWLN